MANPKKKTRQNKDGRKDVLSFSVRQVYNLCPGVHHGPTAEGSGNPVAVLLDELMQRTLCFVRLFENKWGNKTGCDKMHTIG